MALSDFTLDDLEESNYGHSNVGGLYLRNNVAIICKEVMHGSSNDAKFGLG